MRLFGLLGASERDRKAEHRTQVRVPARYYAYLHGVTGALLSECLVKDLSESGARVVLPHAAALPKHLKLRITGEAMPIPASIAWQSGTRCGLSFTKNEVMGSAFGAGG